MNGIDLFSGIGGLSYALKEYVRAVSYVENNPYCRNVLLSRQITGDLPTAPIWNDIRTLSLDGARHCIDIVYGGFPCQDISIAGSGLGLAGERSGLFFEMLRICKEVKPGFIFIENVPAITSRGGVRVVREIASMGYDCRWCVISAASVGAKHVRERWFLLANSYSQGVDRLQIGEKEAQPKPKLHLEHTKWDAWPQDESALLGVDDGIPFRVDRTRALGNAVVPSQAKKAFEILMGVK